MDTRLLHSFLAVVRTGSITAAAAELSYVQSTVTAHVQALERQVGVSLLDRHAGGTAPTSAGLRLAATAQEILDLEERMFEEVRHATEEPAGLVRLLASEAVCAYQLPPVLRALGDRYPQVQLSLVPAGTPVALAALADRQAELALVLEPAVDTRNLGQTKLDVRDLGRQPLSLVASPRSGLPLNRTVTRSEITDAGVLLLEEGTSFSDDFAAFARQAIDTAALPARFGSVETVKRCAEANLGVALLPTAAVRTELDQGSLVELKAPRFATQHLWLARNGTRWLCPATRAVLGLLEETLGT